VHVFDSVYAREKNHNTAIVCSPAVVMPKSVGEAVSFELHPALACGGLRLPLHKHLASVVTIISDLTCDHCAHTLIGEQLHQNRVLSLAVNDVRSTHTLCQAPNAALNLRDHATCDHTLLNEGAALADV